VVKYIANRAAKNINSLASQTMVPTATMLGRFNLGGVTTALLMGVIIPEKAIFLMARGHIPGLGAVRLITRNSP
jgi:hypothetical protein